MNNAEEKKCLELIKKRMKDHRVASYDIGLFERRIGKIKVTPKGWQRLLVPIKGYHYDTFALDKVMYLGGELYFVVIKEHQTYDYPWA